MFLSFLITLNQRRLMTIDDDRFAHAVNIVLEQEGGYSDDKNDHGGPTMYGISTKFLMDCGVKFYFLNGEPPKLFDIKTLTIDNAKLIYRRCYWDKNNYNGINNLRLASAMLSLSVNLGSQTANLLLQNALNSLVIKRVTVDGYIGIKTLALVNTTNSQKLLDELKVLAIEHYEHLVKENENLVCFLEGWKNRVNQL